MNDIGENAKRIQKIVDNLKHLGKQDRGHMDELADVGKILSAVVTLLDTRIRKHTDAFSLALPEALPPVKGNVQQLEQVFINVIVNALESLPDRSRSVKVSATGGAGRRPDHRAGRGSGKRDRRGRHGADRRTLLHHQGRKRWHRTGPVDFVVDRRKARRNMLRFEPNNNPGTTVSIDLPVSTEE
jgi:hypothetical protein